MSLMAAIEQHDSLEVKWIVIFLLENLTNSLSVYNSLSAAIQLHLIRPLIQGSVDIPRLDFEIISGHGCEQSMFICIFSFFVLQIIVRPL